MTDTTTTDTESTDQEPATRTITTEVEGADVEIAITGSGPELPLAEVKMETATTIATRPSTTDHWQDDEPVLEAMHGGAPIYYRNAGSKRFHKLVAHPDGSSPDAWYVDAASVFATLLEAAAVSVKPLAETPFANWDGDADE